MLETLALQKFSVEKDRKNMPDNLDWIFQQLIAVSQTEIKGI